MINRSNYQPLILFFIQELNIKADAAKQIFNGIWDRINT